LFGSSNAILRSNSNPFSDHATGITFTWTVFDGFIREAQLLATNHLRDAADSTLADIKRLIVRAVDRAYYQVQLAGEQLRISRADEAFSREQLEETEKLRGAGRATQADVANFRVRMLAAQVGVTAAVGLYDTGRVILAELMGQSDVLLPDEVSMAPLSVEIDADLAPATAEPWITRASARRPDLHRLLAVVDSEKQNVRAVKGLLSPAVGLSGSWGFDRTSNVHYSNDDQSSAGGIEVRWDLYTGGSRRAQLRGAQAIYAEARAALARLRLSVQAEVRQAVIDLTNAQEQIRLQRENLSTALENRRVVRAGYLAGKETLTRLTLAQRDYIEADAGLARSRIRLRLAWSDLYAAAAFDPQEKIDP
jgi:outer membrane protein TolC